MREFLRRTAAVHVGRFRRGGRGAIAWALRLTAAAVAAYVVALVLFPDTAPLLAPLTALLVVQVTPISLLASGIERVFSVVAGVSIAVAFSSVVPLEWWSLGVLIAVSILLGQALRLGSNLIEVPISAMLVLGVGSVGAESAAWQRITETLVGAGVGVISNLVFPVKVAAEDAGTALKNLADELAGLLGRAADELAELSGASREQSGAGGEQGDGGPEQGGASQEQSDPGRVRSELAAHTGEWLDDARRATHDIPRVGSALLRAEQGRRLNVRALRAPNASPGLRQGMEALEHSAVAVRSMFRGIHDATNDPGWPEGEEGNDALVVLEHVFRDLAAGLAAFGELVRAEAQPERVSRTSEIERVREGLERLHEARARLNEMLLTDTSPVLSELHFSLLSTVKRLLGELDLDQRMRRELRLQPATPPLLARATRLKPPVAPVAQLRRRTGRLRPHRRGVPGDRAEPPDAGARPDPPVPPGVPVPPDVPEPREPGGGGTGQPQT